MPYDIGLPCIEKFVSVGRGAGEIIDINKESGNVTVTDTGADVGSTNVEEVWTQSSDGVLANVGDAQVESETKEKRSDELVTEDDEQRN